MDDKYNFWCTIIFGVYLSLKMNFEVLTSYYRSEVGLLLDLKFIYLFGKIIFVNFIIWIF